MNKIIFCGVFFVLSFVFATTSVVAQSEPVQPPATQPGRPPVGMPPGMPGMGAMPGMPRMNPAMLMRMREQMTFELQQTQRTLGFIDPADTQLAATLKEQQAELAKQLKEINEQLKTQGFPVDAEVDGGASPVTPNAMPGQATEATLSTAPKVDDPTLAPGGLPQVPADPNLLIQRPGMMGGLQTMTPSGMTPGMGMMPPGQMPQGLPQQGMAGMVPGGMPPGMMSGLGMRQPGDLSSVPQPAPPTEFDQDQAWSNSPWTPQPSRELNELKQTVDALRKELAEMKGSIKALETQIQLLNRNILLSQPGQTTVPATQ